MFELLILDESYDLLVRIFNFLRKSDTFKVKSIYGDTKSAKSFLSSEKVDILVINYSGQASIYNLIKEIRQKKLEIKIVLIVESYQKMQKFEKNNIYIDEVIINNFDDNNFIEKIEKLTKIISKKEDKIVMRIEKILKKFCFSKTSRGYYYIVESLNYCIKHEYDYIPKFYELCNEISKIKQNVTSKQIEWDMTKTIKAMSRLTDEEILEKYFPFNPTITTKSFLNEILGIYYTVFRD